MPSRGPRTPALVEASVEGTTAAYATEIVQPRGSRPGSPKAPTCSRAVCLSPTLASGLAGHPRSRALPDLGEEQVLGIQGCLLLQLPLSSPLKRLIFVYKAPRKSPGILHK